MIPKEVACEAHNMSATGTARLFRSFLDLKQGDITLAQYVTKFNELSRLGPKLVDPSLRKNVIFIAGMRPEYHEKMTTHVNGTF